MKEVSRQRRWQLKKQAEGKCTSCGSDKLVTKQHCEWCQMIVNDRVLARYHKNKSSKKVVAPTDEKE